MKTPIVPRSVLENVNEEKPAGACLGRTSTLEMVLRECLLRGEYLRTNLVTGLIFGAIAYERMKIIIKRNEQRMLTINYK